MVWMKSKQSLELELGLQESIVFLGGRTTSQLESKIAQCNLQHQLDDEIGYSFSLPHVLLQFYKLFATMVKGKKSTKSKHLLWHCACCNLWWAKMTST